MVCDQSTPEKFVLAWEMFRRWYLMSTEPGFFYDDLVESSDFHYEMIEDVGRYPYNVFAAPRGFAKSTVMSLELPMMLGLTRKYFKTSLGFSTDKGIEKQLSKMSNQFENNKYIIEDFGIMRPKRGSGLWNNHSLNLMNGSVIDGFSVEGKKRGARPHLFILDDPEYYDDKSESRSTILHDQFNKILFKEIMPMLRPGCSLVWIGTVINMRSFIHYACTSDDIRFKRWNRKVYMAYDSGNNSLWGAMWSEDSLAARKEEIGDAAFSSEYMNTPCSEKDRLLEINPEINEYTVEDYNPDIYDNKITTPVTEYEGIVKYNVRTKETGTTAMTVPFPKLVNTMYRVLTFDYAEGLKSNNDYSCVTITGYTRDNCMWVLDMWLGRAKREKLIKYIYDYAYKWQVRMIGIEAVGMQKELVDSVQDYLAGIIEQNTTFKPPIVPITYGKTHSKQNRIASMQWRYAKGKIKYPAHLKKTFAIGCLYDQTADFTMDLAFLRYDDAIDTVGMSQYMVKNKGVKIEESLVADTPVEQMIKSENPMVCQQIMNGLPTSTLTIENINAIISKRINAITGNNNVLSRKLDRSIMNNRGLRR